MPNTIAVGVDGSEPSLIALRWALGAAAARNAELLVILARPARADRSRTPTRSTATRSTPSRSTRLRDAEVQDQIAANRRAISEIVGSYPLGSHTYGTDTYGTDTYGTDTQRPDIHGAEETGAERRGTGRIRIEELDGTPTEVLLAVSGRVDLLVVGGHGYGGWRNHVMTSVTGRLAVRTKAALCVVRAIAQPVRNRIVVGYDARSGAAAVEFAIAEAEARGATTLIVSTWQYPRDTRATSHETADILEQGATAALSELATGLRLAHPAMPIDTVVRFGYPVDVLVDFAESTDMVVIGSQERSGSLNNGILNNGLVPSGLATLVVGSVAIGVLRRVSTPVIIVPQAG